MKKHLKTGLITALLNILTLTILNLSGVLDNGNSNYLIFSCTSLFLLIGIFKTIQNSILSGNTNLEILPNFKVGLKPVLFFLLGTLASLFIYLKEINPEWIPNKIRDNVEKSLKENPYDTWAEKNPKLAEDKSKKEYDEDFYKSNQNIVSFKFGFPVISILLVILSVAYSFLASIFITRVVIK